MGYVHKPIPPDILAKLPPDLRERAINDERAFLRDVQARQGVVAELSWGILVMVIAGVLFFVGIR